MPRKQLKHTSALLSGRPETPKAKHQRNKFQSLKKIISLPVKWIFLPMLIMMETELGLKKIVFFFLIL
jgi:hypothetical protein